MRWYLECKEPVEFRVTCDSSQGVSEVQEVR